MKRTGNKNLKIIAATMMTIFSLASVFMGTFAWFITNRQVHNSTDSFSVDKVISSITEITVHNCYGSTLADTKKPGNTYGFDPTVSASNTITLDEQSSSGTAGFTMGKYSLDDPHHPVLLLFTLSGAREEINFSTTTTSYLTDLTLQQNTNPLSSVIETHYVLFASDPIQSTTTGSLYVEDNEGNKTLQTKTYIPVTASSLTSNQSSFVTFDQNGEPVFKKIMTAYEGETAGYTHLGIIIDYNSKSLEYIYSYFLGHTYLNDGLGFTCDWSLEL